MRRADASGSEGAVEGRPEDLRFFLVEVDGDPDIDIEGECSGRRPPADILVASWLTRFNAASSTPKQRLQNSVKGRSEASFGLARVL